MRFLTQSGKNYQSGSANSEPTLNLGCIFEQCGALYHLETDGLRTMAQHRGDVSEAQWQNLQPLLPKPAATGRTANAHRQVLNSILWLHRTGAPWSDLPEGYGSRGTGSSRF